jgi:hypothetical protein
VKRGLLRPYLAEEMAADPASPFVNNPRHPVSPAR